MVLLAVALGVAAGAGFAAKRKFVWAIVAGFIGALVGGILDVALGLP